MKLLEDIAKGNDSINDDFAIGVNEFKDSSINLLFVYFIKTGEDILKTLTDTNLAILEKFNMAEIEFAYPTITVEQK